MLWLLIFLEALWRGDTFAKAFEADLGKWCCIQPNLACMIPIGQR